MHCASLRFNQTLICIEGPFAIVEFEERSQTMLTGTGIRTILMRVDELEALPALAEHYLCQ